MGRRRTRSHKSIVWGAVGLSCLLHALVLVGAARWFEEPDPAEPDPPEATSEPAEKLEVTMTREPPEEVEDRTPVEKPPEPPDEPKEPEREEKKEEKDKELVRDYERKAVVQETNEEQPDEADHVSSQSNRVEEETRARETNERFVEQSESSDESQKTEGEAAPDEETKLGSRKAVPRERPPSEPPKRESTPPPEPKQSERESTESDRRAEPEREVTSETAPDAPKPSEDARKPLPMPSPDDVGRIFDENEDRKKVREHAEKGVGHEMFQRIEDNRGAVRSAMTNFISEVKPGNHTAVNAHADVAATYVNRIHSKIHPRWGGDFLPMLDTRYGPNSPFSDSSLNTVLEFVVDGDSGELEAVNIVRSSGLTTYDMQAIAIAEEVAPHSSAPDAIRSPDGNVYLHWNFWRDQRQCGTFGVSIYKLTDDGTKEKTRDPE